MALGGAATCRRTCQQLLRRPLNALFNRNQLAPHAPIRYRPFKRHYDSLRGLFRWTSRFDGPLRRRLRRQVAAAIGTRYATTNMRLQDYTEYDLARFGYRMAGKPPALPGAARDQVPSAKGGRDAFVAV